MMSIVHTLSLLALKEVLPTVVGGKVAEAGTALVGLLAKHFNDPSQRLTKALHAANDRSWKAIEIGLAGDSIWEKCKVAVASGEDKAFRQQLQVFLDTNPLPAVQGKVQFRERCLVELREARKAGVLSGGKLPTAELPGQAATFARFGNQQALEQELKLVGLLLKELKQAKYNNLAWLVAQRPGNGMPLLVLSARYFFRRQVESDPALHAEMTFRTLEGRRRRSVRRVARGLW
jgi:hypothetical protein